MVIDAVGVGVRFGRRWALRDCAVTIPAGSVVALVGPNGAGKTTLLHVLAGLRRPDEGQVRVAGGDPATDLATLGRVGLMAQNAPVYGSFSVADLLKFGAAMNPGWDAPTATGRVEAAGIPLSQKCGTLSGGQRAQVALAIALGKQPDVLLLDEPLASLDPLARTEFLTTLTEWSSGRGATVILSSHLIDDVERLCDYLVLVAGGRIQLAGRVDDIIAAYVSEVGDGRTVSLDDVVVDELRRYATDRDRPAGEGRA